MRSESIHLKIEKIATDFWQLSRLSLEFPLDIERAISRTQPLFIISLPQLSISKIECFLKEKNIPYLLNSENKSLHGFILIQKNCGYIFINGTDSPQERRFTLAHELAHYLIDYAIPRQKVIDLYGNEITEVLDGNREPTIEENIQGIISNISLKPFFHLLDESELSGFDRIAVWQAEEQADHLALELMAPQRQILSDLDSLNLKENFHYYKIKLLALLLEKYGLPVPIAQSYSEYLAEILTGGLSLAEEWGINL